MEAFLLSRRHILADIECHLEVIVDQQHGFRGVIPHGPLPQYSAHKRVDEFFPPLSECSLLLLRSRMDAQNFVPHRKASSPAWCTPSVNSLATV